MLHYVFRPKHTTSPAPLSEAMWYAPAATLNLGPATGRMRQLATPFTTAWAEAPSCTSVSADLARRPRPL